jgi:hypothetical protein
MHYIHLFCLILAIYYHYFPKGQLPVFLHDGHSLCLLRGTHFICTYCFNELQPSSAMSQAVSCQSLSVEAQGKSQACPSGICSRQSGTGTGLSASTLVLPFQYDFTDASFSSSS